MWAGSLSHNGLTGCGIASGDFMSHKLEHEMGGMFDVTHGAGLAALWPSWARYVYKDCLPRFVRFARNVMGVTTDGTDEEIALKGIEAMVDFYHSIGMPASFHELGIDPTDAQIDEMAHRCLEACGSALGSAKKTQPRRHDSPSTAPPTTKKLFLISARHRVFTLRRAFRCLLCASSYFFGKEVEKR